MRTRLFVAVMLLVAGCGGAPAAPPSIPSPPSQEAAMAHLQSVIAVVRSGDRASLCRLGSGTCPHDIQAADPAAWPRTDPTVIGTRVDEATRNADGSWTAGGRVLELCGTDGLDRPYYSEMLVFADGDRLISIGTVYWIGTRIAERDTAGVSSPQPLPCPST